MRWSVLRGNSRSYTEHQLGRVDRRPSRAPPKQSAGPSRAPGFLIHFRTRGRYLKIFSQSKSTLPDKKAVVHPAPQVQHPAPQVQHAALTMGEDAILEALMSTGEELDLLLDNFGNGDIPVGLGIWCP